MPLDGLRVIDASTVFAGPSCARYLADFGADVIKVERPDGGDSVRRMGWPDPRDGVTLWWKLAARNKRCIALDLKDAADLDVFLRLCDRADVLVENFRPGTLERLGLGPDVLLARNPSLVVTRVTGFGQDGPYATKPGFASIAEAMSGFAAINGEAHGGPLLPPIALTDEVAGLAAAFATMVALHSGVGQVVDVNLLESLFQLMGPLMSAYRLFGYLQPRAGSAIPYTVPRGTFRCADGTWVAISTSADSVAARVMRLHRRGRRSSLRHLRGTHGAPRRAGRDRDGVDRGPAAGRGDRRLRRRRGRHRPRDDHGRRRCRSPRAGTRHGGRGRRHADAGSHRPLVGHTGPAALDRAGPGRRW